MTDLAVVFRDALPEDMPYIASSWLESFCDDPTSPKAGLSRDQLVEAENRVITHLLELAATVCAVRDGTDELCGWICYQPGELHYVYVKEPYRGAHVAKRLLEYAGLLGLPERRPSLLGLPVAGPQELKHTHMTSAVLAWKEKGHRFHYSPFRLW
jgi:hypothetical protein